MRAILIAEIRANETGVLSVNLSTGTFWSPCVAEIGAIESSGVKSTASEYSAIRADFVVKGGALKRTTFFGVTTVKDADEAIMAPKETSSPGSSTPLLFRSRYTGAKGLMS